jgi:hypothetical protein
MLKYGYKRTAACTLCQTAHEESGSIWNGELPKETIGHIQSAGCLGQKEVVTAAHNECIWELLQEVNVHGSSSYWPVYKKFASQSQHKYKIIIFFFRRSK